MSMSKFASKDDYYVSKIQERDKAIVELQAKYDALELQTFNRNEYITELEQKLAELREAAEDYLKVGDVSSWGIEQDRLIALLKQEGE